MVLPVGSSTEPKNGRTRLFILRDEAGGAARASFPFLVGDGNDQCRLCSSLFSVGDYLHLAVCDVIDWPLLDRFVVVLSKQARSVRGLYDTGNGDSNAHTLAL